MSSLVCIFSVFYLIFLFKSFYVVRKSFFKIDTVESVIIVFKRLFHTKKREVNGYGERLLGAESAHHSAKHSRRIYVTCSVEGGGELLVKIRVICAGDRIIIVHAYFIFLEADTRKRGALCSEIRKLL